MNVIIERLNEVVFRVSIEGDITFSVKVRNQPVPYRPYATIDGGLFLDGRETLDVLLPEAYALMERLERGESWERQPADRAGAETEAT